MESTKTRKTLCCDINRNQQLFSHPSGIANYSGRTDYAGTARAASVDSFSLVSRLEHTASS